MSTDLPAPATHQEAEAPQGASPRLSEAERSRLAEFADELIPGGSGLPSASGAEVHLSWVDRVLAARPDLVGVVRSSIAATGSPADVLAGLRSSDSARFDDLAYVVSGAYLINPRVRRILGYPTGKPVRNPALPDEADAYLEDGILEPVLGRGPIYREVS